MTGRARGRSRGRGRVSVGGEAARRPGDVRPEQAPVGRGRARGPPPQAPAAAPQKPAAPPTEQLSRMSVQEEQRPRRQYGEEPVTRPAHVVDKRGGSGGPIALVTNHFKLKQKPTFGIYQYNVSFNPTQESKIVRVALLSSQQEIIGKVHAFDGMVLFLPKRLPDSVTTVNLTTRNNDPVQMIITFTNDVPPDSPSVLQLYNIIFRRILKQIEMRQVGRNYYHVESAIMIQKFKLELWPGYSTSILPYETDILLSADVSHKVLRTQTVLEYLYELYESRCRDFHEEACKKLVGQIVLTRYNNKTYRVDDIKWDKFPTDTFPARIRGQERDISYVQYYQDAYEKEITDMDQPLLVSRLKKIPGQIMRIPEGEVFLVPELCYITGLTDEMRNDFMLMKDLAVHTRVDPKTRNKSLLKFMGDIQRSPMSAAELEGWNLEFESSTLALPGRVVPSEKIYQKGKSYNYDPKSADWSREMRGNPLHSTVKIEKWALIYSTRDTGNAKDFAQTLQKVCGPMGIRVERPDEIQLQNDRTDSYLNAIKSIYDGELNIVVTIVTTNRKDRYDAIKKLCCLEMPVPSQVIVGRTISKKQMLMSVCTKIGIQLNCKLGGEAWAVEIPLKNTMVIGIDCYHDSSSKGRSVGGFVASMNQTLTKYYSKVSFQHTGMELIDGLKTNMTASLRNYLHVNGSLPDRILIYRDGVGDGQLRLVVEHEVPQLKAALKDIGADYSPKFTVIIVKKRISARLFHKGDPRDATNLTNPPPGTVVDSDITRKEWYDFFLVSQSVRQGTVSPTHYNVITDTSGLNPDHLQRLTYKLTHLYYNWPGTVRVPAPCQYAHKLAFLVGQSLHKSPAPALADKLFFL